MRIAVEAQTDVGLVRELNEDNFRVLSEQHALVVCDGMGGHAAGEVASATAADTISDIVRKVPDPDPALPVVATGDGWPPEASTLALAVRLANRRLYNEAARSHKLRGMGTTVVAAMFLPGKVILAHVGDSRAYRIAGDSIEQLTTDHSWVAELIESGHVRPEDAETFADRNVITRALGTRPGVAVDLGVHPTADGEVYLFCSDGLCGYVSDTDILGCITAHRSDLKAAARALIEAANAAGGMDNSTVALVGVEEAGAGESSHRESVTLAEESESELAGLDAVLANRYQEVSKPEDTTDGQTSAAKVEAEVDQARHRGWRWLVLLLLLAALVLLVVRARRRQPATSPSAPPATTNDSLGAQPPARRDSLSLLFVAPGHTDRAARAYLDGVLQGSLNDLEYGLLVEPGKHRLTVITPTGDTVYNEGLELEPNDTLDLVVQ
jgi:protein phosphatase